MAKRITDEQIEQINEVYYQCKVKSQTAKIVGVSVASVTKYIKPDYVPKSQQTEVSFDKKLVPLTVKEFREIFSNWNEVGLLSNEEKEQFKTLQKQIYV